MLAGRLLTALAIAAFAGCSGASHARAGASGTPGPHTVALEQADLDAALRRTPHADAVASYAIADDRVTFTVDAHAWDALGAAEQDRLKRALWRAWAASYTHRVGPTTEELFVLFEDQLARNLGSYFARVR